MMAAGGSVEPFWEIYAVHKANPQVLELIELYRIGNIDPRDLATASEAGADPFANEPERHPALRPVSQKPFNAETPPPMLVQKFYTPNKLVLRKLGE
jgi:sulfite oxidase